MMIKLETPITKKPVFRSSATTTSITNQGAGFLGKRLTTPGYDEVMDIVKATNTTNFAKSTTRHFNQGNVKYLDPRTIKQYIQPFEDDSMYNAVALTNMGAYYNAVMCLLAALLGYFPVPSIYVEFSKYGTCQAIRKGLEAFGIFKRVMGKHFHGADWNGSCGNSSDDITKNFSKLVMLGEKIQEEYPDDIHSIKYSLFHPTEHFRELTKYFQILHGINSINAGLLDAELERMSPLLGLKNINFGGSISGGRIFEPGIKKNREVARAVEGTDCRLVFSGGITTFDRARQYFDEIIDEKKHSIGICSGIERKPEEAKKILLHYNT